MERRDFVRLWMRIASALGLGGGLALGPGLGPGGADHGFAEGEEPERKRRLSGDDTAAATLDSSYLVRGLTGMARAAGWFDAHWGAAVIAGYYLCHENRLEADLVADIKDQLDTLIRLRGEQFEPLEEQPADPSLSGQIAAALRPAVEGGLRAHGHAVIFASLSLKALRDVPSMSQPGLIQSLCGLSRQIARQPPQKLTEPQPAYADTDAMIAALFDSLARFKPLLGHPSAKRPNFTHMTTHTEALLNLSEMGYTQLAQAGIEGHRVHIAAPVPKLELGPGRRRTSPASLDSIMSTEFWEDPEHREQWRKKWNVADNRNGDWIASGHLFKVLYSYHRLIPHIQDQNQVRLCSRILFERYFNPAVEGG